MSLKRKCNFDQHESSPTTCQVEDGSMIRKYIKTEEFLNNNSPSNDERKFKFVSENFPRHRRIILADDFTEKYVASSPSLSNECHSEETKVTVHRNRRKNLSQSKFSRNPPLSTLTSTTPTSIPMILSLIDSLIDEKQFDNNNDENLLLTIDCLINNLKHLREKIQTIHHDDSHPLNLSKPKMRQQNYDDIKSTTASTNFPLTSPLFSTQPFFPPFSGKIFLSKTKIRP